MELIIEVKSVFNLGGVGVGGEVRGANDRDAVAQGTEARENKNNFVVPWPPLTVTWATQVAASSLVVPTSASFGSWNSPLEVPSATSRCHASHS